MRINKFHALFANKIFLDMATLHPPQGGTQATSNTLIFDVNQNERVINFSLRSRRLMCFTLVLLLSTKQFKNNSEDNLYGFDVYDSKNN